MFILLMQEENKPMVVAGPDLYATVDDVRTAVDEIPMTARERRTLIVGSVTPLKQLTVTIKATDYVDPAAP